MSPRVGIRYPVRALSNEVLPEPLAPSMTQCCPRSTRQEMLSRMTVWPRWMHRPEMSKMDCVCFIVRVNRKTRETQKGNSVKLAIYDARVCGAICREINVETSAGWA